MTRHDEYDRNIELNDFLHRQQGQPYDRSKLKEHIDSCWGEQRIDRNSDLIGKVYVSREWLEENCQECRDREEWLKADRKTSRQALVVLILVFAGAVLWKVWVG